MAETPIDLLVAMREILRRAVITLAVLRDPDRRFLGLSSLPQHVIHDVQEAYGWASASVRAFQPTAYEITQSEIVLPWLAWLRREHGDTACRRFIAWAMGSPTHRLASRENCSERTIMNRIDRSVSVMIANFVGPEIIVEQIEEPYIDLSRVTAAIDAIPKKYGDILIEFSLGSSYEDLARKQNVKLGTIKSRLSRAKDRIRYLRVDVLTSREAV